MPEERPRVGIITFHWAANYGAVLQAYALQLVLRRAGFDAEIVDFVPYRVYLSQAWHRLRSRQFRVFLKEYQTQRFIRTYAHVSGRPLFTGRSVSRLGGVYHAIVVGSDQIWNENLTLTGEKGPLLAYFLGGMQGESRKVAYAVSFGTGAVSLKYSNIIRPLVQGFDSIGVREVSGVRIVGEYGVAAKLVLDPALLLRREDYEQLLEGSDTGESGGLVAFILHGQEDDLVRAGKLAVSKQWGGPIDSLEDASIDVRGWLRVLMNSRFVITNSYHAVIFCVHFNIPFLVLPVRGSVSGMNDRMDTLLSTLGLEERMLNDSELGGAIKLVSDSIDWISVAQRLDIARIDSLEFLLSGVRGGGSGVC